MVSFTTNKPIWIIIIKKGKENQEDKIIVSKEPRVCVELLIDELTKGKRMTELKLHKFSIKKETFEVEEQAGWKILEMASRFGLLKPTYRSLDPKTAFEVQSFPQK